MARLSSCTARSTTCQRRLGGVWLDSSRQNRRFWGAGDIGDQIAAIFCTTTIQALSKKADGLGIERQLDARFMYYI